MHEDQYTLDELCRGCRVEVAVLVEWVELGVVRPSGARPADWRFGPEAHERLVSLARLARELELPPHAAALVHDLLQERGRLERRLRLLERLAGERPG